MYIIYEFTSSDNPLETYVEFFSTYWVYRVGYIKPENESLVDLSALGAVEIPWEVARASKFAVYNSGDLGNIIKFIYGDKETHEMFSSGEREMPEPSKPGAGAKALYELNDADKENTVIFLKTMMTVENNWHFSQLTPEETAQWGADKPVIQAEIDSCQTIEDCHRVLHKDFGCSAHTWQCEEEELDPPTWDLSEPKLEIRRWGRRYHAT